MPTKKRKRTVAAKRDASTYPAGEFTLTLREISESKDGYSWSSWLVQGWAVTGEDGKKKWQRRKCKNREDALAFIYAKQVELANDQADQQRVVTRLKQDQVREAEDAFHRLGDRYTVRQAVEFFLNHYAEPDFTIKISKAKLQFLSGKEREGVRWRSIRQLDSTLTQFQAFAEDANVHEITAADVERFLRSLRARDRVHAASWKTWNNVRADLSSFFGWCIDPQRKWINHNPAAATPKRKSQDRDLPEILTAEQAQALMESAETFKDGKMVRYFALALFTGLRTGPEGELHKLARHPDRDKLIDLKNGVVHVPPEISKTRQKRQIVIRPNLRAWLESSDPEILPPNHDRMIKAIRKKHGLTHDVLRHSFISYHVAAGRSVGDAALEAGNSEGVVKKHYLNLATRSEGEAFWMIGPDGVRMELIEPEREFLKLAS